MNSLYKILFYFVSSLISIVPLRAEEPVIVGYFTEWGIYDRNYHVTDIPADKLTHVIYSFANISQAGEVVLFDTFASVEKTYPGDSWNEPVRGSFKQLQKLKKQNPHLKTLIAIGGWTLSDLFTEVASSQKARAKFAESAVKFMKEYGFDGIDIDWEFPVGGGIAKGRPEDKQNLTLLLAELRSQLNKLESKTKKKYFLTVASSAGDPLNNYELGKVAQYIDWYNLMAYDFHGSWEKTTNHQAALLPSSLDTSPLAPRYNITYAINAYLQDGVPASKIVLGLPLYSRGWSGVHPASAGFAAENDGPSKGTWEPGILDYKDVYTKLQKEPDAYKVHWDEEAMAAWIYNPNAEGGLFYTYEDVRTIKHKLDYIKSNNLRGAMFWELSSDLKSNHPDSLLKTVREGL